MFLLSAGSLAIRTAHSFDLGSDLSYTGTAMDILAVDMGGTLQYCRKREQRVGRVSGSERPGQVNLELPCARP